MARTSRRARTLDSRLRGNDGRIGNDGHGFTLIELLVALAVFAIMSVMAYGGLRTVLQARERAAAQSERFAELQVAIVTIGRDLQQALNRPVRDEFGDRGVAMTGTSEQIEFTRGGWRNPAGLQRSELQRVGYLVDGEELQRLTWAVLDRAQGAEPRSAVLLGGVKALELRFLDSQGEWLETWPPAGSDPLTAAMLPRAVEVSVETDDWDRITRLFAITPGLPPQLNSGALPAGDGNGDGSQDATGTPGGTSGDASGTSGDSGTSGTTDPSSGEQQP